MTRETWEELKGRLVAESLPRARRARRLREAGETWAAIGLLLGVSRQRAAALVAQAVRHDGPAAGVE
jgi:hypothetical protein